MSDAWSENFMNPTLKQLSEQGQSIWYDNIRRGMLVSGEMQALIDDGVVGVTSNPSIFQKAIGQSSDYDDALRSLTERDLDTFAIYDALTIEDIQMTADLFRPVYDRTNGADGFVSLEVNPKLAYDTDATIAEARRLFTAVDRPNVMIKIPGTDEGIPAIRAVIGGGINVNVTLIFAVSVYEKIMTAYMDGLEDLLAAGGDPAKVASVASFFVSRVDTAVDKQLDARIDAGDASLSDLRGQAAIANSKLAYARYQEVFAGSRFANLRAKGARVQRPLWASTSTKNPAYRDTLYVDTLIGPDTVNTVPPQTLDAIRRGITVAQTVTQDVDQARDLISRLESLGISMDQVTADLRTAGVKAFADAFDALLADLQKKGTFNVSRK